MKKNLLFLLHLPPPIHGSSVMGLMIKESITINKEFNCTYINLLASQKVSESGIISFNKILGFSITFFKVLVSLLKNRPQLCYFALSTTGAAFYKDVILVSLLKLFRIKLIYHLHNKGISRYQHKFFNHLCYNFVFRNTEVIILSAKLYSDIQSFVSFSKVHICPNGIKDEFAKFKFSSSLEFKYSSDDDYMSLKGKTRQNSKKNVRILFLSNLIETKGVFVLLEACALLMRKGINFECIFIGGVGDITASQFNEKVNRLGLEDYVSYQGKKIGEEKNKAFQEANIFAFPTYEDCFPLVLIESMYHYLPIVSTFEGGIKDIIDDEFTGFLIPQKNVEKLAEKLELLIIDSNLRLKMGKAGRKKYEQNFTLEIFQDRMIEILINVIEKD